MIYLSNQPNYIIIKTRISLCNMKILLSPQKEELNIKKILLEGWAKKMTIREGIHVSDLVYCKRKVCYNNLNPVSQDMSKKKTEVKAHMILGGELAHLKLQSLLLGDEFKCEQEVVYTCRDGTKVVGHIDVIHIPSNTYIEFKTTESVSVVENCYPYNLLQLLYRIERIAIGIFSSYHRLIVAY
jgi:hypothetical protein